MSGGYPRGKAPTELAGLIDELADLKARVKTLERPSGEQLAKVVEELTALVNDIQTQLDNYISTQAYTKSQVDARIVNPGIVGNVSSGGSARFNGGLYSTGVYGQLVTYGGAYRAVWAHEDGTLGYAPSSRDFKADEAPFRITVEDALKLQAITFRYLPRAPYAWGREELGGIAQDVAAAGFPWLVDHDEDGQPFGLRNDLVAWVVLEGMRDLYDRTLGGK